MKISLKFQIPFIVVLLVSFIIGAVGTFIIRHEKDALTEARNQRGKILLMTLVSEATEAILSDNYPKILSYCNSLTIDESGVKHAMIIDTNWVIIAHSTPAMAGKECTSDRCLSILKSQEFLIAPLNYENEKLTDFSVPLFIAEKRVGSARIIMSDGPLNMSLRQIIIHTVVLSLILIVISFGLAWLFTHFLITKQIRLLAVGMETSSTGDFNRRITAKINNEFGDLLKLYNRMNKALYKQKNDLFKLYNSVQTLDVNRELTSLLSQSIEIVNQFFSPNHCIVCLVEKNNLIIKETSGLVKGVKLHDSLFTLPNEIFNETFKKKVSHKFIARSLAETFNKLNVPLENPTDEVLISPLVYGKKSKGLFILIGKRNGTEYSETDSKFLDIIALATAMSLFNIELIKKANKQKSTESESEIAEITRKVLMPQRPFKMKGIEICSYYRPAGNTHGNWHGFIEDKDNNRLSVFIGDASGQGVHAAIAASMASSFIKTMSMLKKQKDMLTLIVENMPDIPIDQRELPLSMKPSYLLTLLNRILYSNAYGKHSMTFFASTFDLVKKRVYYANAGHEIPVLIKKKGSLPAALISSGARLGDSEEATYKEYTLDLDPEDVIIWYSTGVTQCLNSQKESYGNNRFLRKIQDNSSFSAQDICKNIVEDIHSFRAGTPLADDITLVTGKIL